MRGGVDGATRKSRKAGEAEAEAEADGKWFEVNRCDEREGQKQGCVDDDRPCRQAGPAGCEIKKGVAQLWRRMTFQKPIKTSQVACEGP